MTAIKKIHQLTPNADCLSELLGYHLRAASKTVQADLALTLAQFELRMITYSALKVISNNAGLRQSQLADVLSVERPNLVVIIDELDRKELIERKQVKHDKRAYALEITPKGSQLLAQADAAVQKHEARIFGMLAVEEQEALRHILTSIAQSGAQK